MSQDFKVLHIVGGELNGGAARGAYWLHKGLLKSGISSRILTNSRDTFGDDTVTSVAVSRKQKIKDVLRSQLDVLPVMLYRQRRRVIFHCGLVGFDFIETEAYKWADIVHFHWINGGFVNIKHFSKISKPIVWTMRDMWPVTGGCHYALDCNNYESGCGTCKVLSSYKKYDLSRFVLWRKKYRLPRDMKVVGISNWLSDCARNSQLFKEFDVRTISNNIDTHAFRPVNKEISRDILGLPKDKKIVLAGAHSLRDPWKGFNLYLEALRYVKDDDIFLLFFGKIDSEIRHNLRFEYKMLDFLHDVVSLRLAYSAADVFVASSTMEAFGKTLVEAMACRTPVVCFDATGPKDIVDHKKTGYKAVPFDAKDLVRGIEWVVEDDTRQKLIGKNAREKVLREFDSRIVAKKYISLYEEIVTRA